MSLQHQSTNAHHRDNVSPAATQSDCASCASGFDNLGITPKLLAGLARLGFTDPTPIQKKSIPVGIKGRDILALAQTGSGKTIAFGVPMLQRLAQQSKRSNNSNKTNDAALILVPTRELALQVEESLRLLSRSLNLHSAVIIGGAPMSPQLRDLRRKPEIIIATPGRLMDHLERRSVNLSAISVFILDEADRMLDMGFMPAIKTIMKSIPQERQTMLFSATMPKGIAAIAEQLLRNPERIEVDRSGATPHKVSQEMFFVDNQDRGKLLAVRLKECDGPALVFTRTKRMASRLTNKVNKMGFSAAEIHSDRSLGQRRNALEGFKRGKYQILIATDIAARGIDVPGIELVVNYDMPANAEDYVHRIGRTGRAGKTGHAISFAMSDQVRSIKSLERFLKTKLTVSKLPILPSEKFLMQHASNAETSADSRRTDVAPRGNLRRELPAKRRNFTKSPFKKFAKKKTFAPQSDTSEFDSENKRPGRKRPGKQKPARERNRSPLSLDDIIAQAEAPQNYPDNSGSNLPTFKKKRHTKKESIGQGSSRKKHTKRK